MKRQRLRSCGIKVPKDSAFKIKTPDELPKLHGVFLFCAKRGSGKSVAISNLLRMYKSGRAMDRVFLLSPTYYSNKHLYDPYVTEEDVYTQPTDASLAAIVAEIEREAQDLEEYKEKKKRYDAFMKRLSAGGHMDDLELMEFFDEGQFKEPTHKWGGRPPTIAIVGDDLQGSPLMRPFSSLMNVVVKHRHLGKGLGATIFLAVQNFRTQGGVAKAIRGNVTCLCLWRTQNALEKKAVAEECSGEVNEDTFERLYKEACSEPHSFLTMDFHKKDHHPSMFRHNFDQFLVPPNDTANGDV